MLGAEALSVRLGDMDFSFPLDVPAAAGGRA